MVTQKEPAFSHESETESRNRTIRIATIKNRFRCFYRCSDRFQHLNFCQSRRIQSSRFAGKPNLHQLAAENTEEEVIFGLDEASFGVSTRIVLLLYFSIPYSLMS